MHTLGTLKTLVRLSLLPIRGVTHEQRLESFYQCQAKDYDLFRKRLLHGRREMIKSLPTAGGGVWCDMGAGTGENLEYAGSRLSDLSRVYLVDLCPSLLRVARQRVDAHGWPHVEVINADAETFQPAATAVDLVTFSYSLSMIPDWIVALENAWRMLRPGGHLGIVDFYVSRKFPVGQEIRHTWFTRTFWPTWFALDNVYLRPDLVPFLTHRFTTVRLDECQGTVPFLWGARVPYFIFVGRKIPDANAGSGA
jgi:S-adenosylmethionine-diacylgycerolhomoserine-N-methlytransferase